MFTLGIDVSQKTSRYLFLNPEGRKVKSFTLENSPEGFQNLLQRLQELSIPQADLLIGMEATGNFWENLYSYLKEKGFSVVLLNPYHVKKYREALAKKAKTDDIDALVIAQFLRTGEYVQSQVAEESIQSLREITRLRYELLTEKKTTNARPIPCYPWSFPSMPKRPSKTPSPSAPWPFSSDSLPPRI